MGLLSFQIIQEFEDAEYSTIPFEEFVRLWSTFLSLYCKQIYICRFIFYVCICISVVCACVCLVNMYDMLVCRHMPQFLCGEQNITFGRQGPSYMVCAMNEMISGLLVSDHSPQSLTSPQQICMLSCATRFFTWIQGSGPGSQACTTSDFTH